MSSKERSDVWHAGLTPRAENEPVRSSCTGQMVESRPPERSEDRPDAAASGDLCRICVVLLLGLESAQMLNLA